MVWSAVTSRMPRTSLRMLDSIGDTFPTRHICSLERQTSEAIPTSAGKSPRARMKRSSLVVARPRYLQLRFVRAVGGSRLSAVRERIWSIIPCSLSGYRDRACFRPMECRIPEVRAARCNVLRSKRRAPFRSSRDVSAYPRRRATLLVASDVARPAHFWWRAEAPGRPKGLLVVRAVARERHCRH